MKFFFSEKELSKRELFLTTRENQIKIDEMRLALDRENFEREKANIRKELEWEYRFNKKALEEEWHCKLGNQINNEWDKLHEQYVGIMKELLKVISELKVTVRK